MKKRLLLLIIILPGLIGSAVWAQSADLFPDDAARHIDNPRLDGLKADRYRKESEIALPEGYDENALQRFEIDGGSPNFTYAIDTRAITYGADNAIRYVLAVESRSGARNAYFEAMRCDIKEYRTYGYANPSGAFRRSRDSAWTPVVLDPWQLRKPLAEQILCDDWSRPVSERELKRRLQGSGANRLYDDPAHGFH